MATKEFGNCPVCGVRLTSARARFCSDQHRSLWHYYQHRDEGTYRPPPGKTYTQRCQNCGELFTSRRPAKYCGVTCRVAATRKRQRQSKQGDRP